MSLEHSAEFHKDNAPHADLDAALAEFDVLDKVRPPYGDNERAEWDDKYKVVREKIMHEATQDYFGVGEKLSDDFGVLINTATFFGLKEQRDNLYSAAARLRVLRTPHVLPSYRSGQEVAEGQIMRTEVPDLFDGDTAEQRQQLIRKTYENDKTNQTDLLEAINHEVQYFQRNELFLKGEDVPLELKGANAVVEKTANMIGLLSDHLKNEMKEFVDVYYKTRSAKSENMNSDSERAVTDPVNISRQLAIKRREIIIKCLSEIAEHIKRL